MSIIRHADATVELGSFAEALKKIVAYHFQDVAINPILF